MSHTREIVTEPTDRKATNEANGFQMIPSCVLNSLTAGEITPSAMATYTAIVSFCNADRTGHPYRRTIATRTNQSVPTVARHIAQLRDARLLQIVSDPYGGPSMYRVSDPCGGCFTPSHSRPDPVSTTTRPRITGDTHKGTRSSELNPPPKASRFASHSESVTNPSPDKLDPTTCPHKIETVDDGYCTACATWLNGEPEPIATGSPPTVDQLTAAIVESATIPGPEPGTAEWRQIQDTLPL